MRLSTVGKLLSLAALSIVTCLATSKILAQVRTDDKAAPAPVPLSIRMDPPDPNRLPPVVLPGNNGNPLKHFEFDTTKANIGADGHNVHINAQVHLHDDRPDLSYLWSVRLYNAPDDPKDMNLLSERFYKNQVFTVPVSTDADPTFDEAIAVDPGVYYVQICFYALPNAGEVEKL